MAEWMFRPIRQKAQAILCVLTSFFGAYGRKSVAQPPSSYLISGYLITYFYRTEGFVFLCCNEEERTNRRKLAEKLQMDAQSRLTVFARIAERLIGGAQALNGRCETGQILFFLFDRRRKV